MFLMTEVTLYSTSYRGTAEGYRVMCIKLHFLQRALDMGLL